MAGACTNKLHDFLFQNENTQLVNLKLLRGDSPDVSKEDICDQLHSAFLQVASGQVVPLDDFPDIDGACSIELAGLDKKL